MIRMSLSITLTVLLFSPALTGRAEKQMPNILFITMDDMIYDSIGAYGCSILGISPSIDRLSHNGLRFSRAYVQATTCAPSRNVFQSGRYPHSSGIRGFYNVDIDFKILPELLKEKWVYYSDH